MAEERDVTASAAGQARAQGELASWRARIDVIDGQLMRLLNSRSACAVEIGFSSAENSPEEPVKSRRQSAWSGWSARAGWSTRATSGRFASQSAIASALASWSASRASSVCRLRETR